MNEKPRVLVIVGPTASGKTSLSIKIAKKFNGEVISADSRQVYRGLDIGSGKVTEEEMEGVPHHLLNVADPKDVYTASDFVRDGRKAITDILERGKLPIVVGGTFFYVDALLGRISTPEVPPNEKLRAKLEDKSAEELFETLQKADPRRAESIDKKNKRRLIRALEIVDALGVVPLIEPEEIYHSLIIGIDIPKEELHKNIHTRLIERIGQGMIEEVEQLHESGVSWERLESLGLEYRHIAQFLQGKYSKEEMLEALESEIRKFAKRQMTWLKRGQSVHWFSKDNTKEIFTTIKKFLSCES